MKHYYCDCQLNSDQKLADQGRTSIREVEVDSEEICTNCGYYAISTNETVKSRIELYSLLRIGNE